MWCKTITEGNLGVDVPKNVADILKDNHVQPSEIDSVIWREVDYIGRNFREIDFDKKPLVIGPFRGFDFFGDGSFYLLDTPGHAIGHVAGLARTTTDPDTFIFMGGDLCHHGVLDDVNVKRGRKPGETFFDPNIGFDIEQAIETVKEAQKADAQDHIFFIFAHDMSVMGIVDEFPSTLNDWKAKGWKEKTQWRFLNDFEEAIKEESKQSG
ncbi:hypothetical protein ACHAPD_010916 [Fusarium lateritium]